MMEKGDFDNKRRTGSVKAAIDMYGERIHGGRPSLKKSQIELPEESSSKAKGLDMVRRDMNRLEESRRNAESKKAQAESELRNARNTAKELAQKIEESNSRAKSKMKDIETINKPGRLEENSLNVRSKEGYQYDEVMRELESVKQELSRIKLDIASVLDEKSRAEEEAEASRLKTGSNLGSVDKLGKEIEEVNEEHVLVELARLEAMKEYAEIEAQREKEADEFSFSMEETRKKKNEMVEEIGDAEELENKLAVTLCDISVLQNELKQIKEMGTRGIDMEDSNLLQSINEELEAAKRELGLIRDERFEFMGSMDVIRNELRHVIEETERLRTTEEESGLTMQNLNSKLLRAKSKLESVSEAEEKAKGIVSNLIFTLEQLKTEEAAAIKEKEVITDETTKIKGEIRKTESEIDLCEDKLRVAMEELNEVKSSEALALEKLKSLIDNTIQSRASTSKHSSFITISKFEYEYLTSHASMATDVADKKVAAAYAWVEALKASEREISMKMEKARREMREKRAEEKKEGHKKRRSVSGKRAGDGGGGELKNGKLKREKHEEEDDLEPKLNRKSMTPSRRPKFRKSISGSPAASRISFTPSTSFTIKKKTKVMPNFTTLFGGKKINKDP